jgi:radical SAM protein with 4Fe4S-binding SPASM domain
MMTYSPFRHIPSIFRKSLPIHLTFFLTRRCNSRCPYCFYLSDNNSSDDTLNELSVDEIKKVSSSLGKLLWLAFSGGEIFLRDDIVEISRIFYSGNKPSIMLFPTNGLLHDTISNNIEAILKYCKKSTIVVKLSLDGTGDLHDSIRGTKDGFQRTMQTYNTLAGLLGKYPNFELGINTVFCSGNQNSMNEIINFVNGLEHIKTHTVSLIRGDITDDCLKDVDIGKYNEAVKKIESNLKEKRSAIYRFRGAKLKAAQDILQRRLIYQTVIKRKSLIPCYAGRLNLVLTETGDLYPCESFSMKLGNVKDYGYDPGKLMKIKKARDIIASIKNNGCYCTHECYFMTNILFNPRLYPALLKEYLQV